MIEVNRLGHAATAILLALLFSAVVGAGLMCFLTIIGYFGGYAGVIVALIVSVTVAVVLFAYTARALYRGFRTNPKD